VPQNLITAIVLRNETRKDNIVREIMRHKPTVVGVFGLAMKAGSDNFRESAIHGVIERLKVNGLKVFIYEPCLNQEIF